MPELTRRRDPEVREESWNIYYGDVRAGTIALRTSIPHDEDPWGWICGFYPGSRPGEHTDGTAATFEQARADFEQAWRVFLTKRTEADFQAWRDQRDWTAWKYAMPWDGGKARQRPLPDDCINVAASNAGHENKAAYESTADRPSPIRIRPLASSRRLERLSVPGVDLPRCRGEFR